MRLDSIIDLTCGGPPGKGPGSGHYERHPSLESFDKHTANVRAFKDSKSRMNMLKDDVRRWNKQYTMASLRNKPTAYSLQMRENAKKLIQEGEANHEQLKSVVAQGSKLAHPEAGQFVRQPADPGKETVWKSPSGDTVKRYHFGGWSMQRVAPSSSVTFKSARTGDGYEQEWTGQGARDSAVKHMKNVFGIDEP